MTENDCNYYVNINLTPIISKTFRTINLVYSQQMQEY